MIELRHLRYFVVVAEELHFGRAADRLSMAQSPLSHQIRQLERTLGTELISRSHHVVGLTDAGRSFLASARAILDELDQATYLARRAARGEVGTLVVGYVTEVTADLLPLSLKAFKERFGDIELDLREGTTGALLDMLRRGQLDVAFVRSPGLVGELRYEELIVETLMAALPESEDWPKECESLTDLAEREFVLPMFQAAEGLRKDVEAGCQAAGFQPRVAREGHTLTAVLLLVAAGVGMALIPAAVAHEYPVPGVRYCRLGQSPPLTVAGMAWRGNEPSEIVNNFLNITREIAAQYAGQVDVWPERHIIDSRG